MDSSLSHVLELSSEAALLVKRGRVSFANTAARRLLGEDCVGRNPEALLGENVTGNQSGSFVAGLPLGQRGCILRALRIEEGQLYFLSQPEADPALLNEPVLFQMRSELMSLSLSADLLRQRAESLGDSTMLSSVQAMTRSYYRMKRLSANAALVLACGKGQLSSRGRPFDLSALYDSMLCTVCELFPTLKLRRDLGRQICVHASSELLRQLLMNLLSNALIHAKGMSRISVSLTDTGGNVVLSVDDDGCGIPAEALHSVFERYRYPYTADELIGGAGLGLSVCRVVATLYGGVLLLESREGQGTAVRVCLGKSISPAELLHSEDDPTEPTPLQALLLGLSDCLPEDCFTERYAD